jgi:hypothetical protein
MAFAMHNAGEAVASCGALGHVYLKSWINIFDRLDWAGCHAGFAVLAYFWVG